MKNKGNGRKRTVKRMEQVEEIDEYQPMNKKQKTDHKQPGIMSFFTRIKNTEKG